MSNQFIVINEIEELLNDVNDELTTSISATKSVVDTIKTNVDTIKTNTAANGTESMSGTLSQKLSYLINRQNKIVTPSNATLKTLATSKSIEASGNISEDYQLSSGTNSLTYSAYVKYCGTYRISVTYSTTFMSNNVTPSNCTEGETKTHDVVITVKSSENNSSNEFTYSASGYYNTGISSSTKTFDVFCNAGAKIQVVVKLTSLVYFNICNGAYYYAANHKLDVSDISIRGTLNEINGAIM